MWIDRIVTETDDGSELLELHHRLTVISSPDRALRRRAYEKVYQALKGVRGNHLEVQTVNDDKIIALRPTTGDYTLVDGDSDEPIDVEHAKRIGVAAQLNDAEAMTNHLRVLHASPDSLMRRADSDADMINLAQTPLDQLWTIANSIQADQETLNHTTAQGDNLNAAAAMRDSTEEEIVEILNRKAENDRKNLRFYVGAGVALLLALIVALTINTWAAGLLVLVAIGLGAAGALSARNETLIAEHASVSEQYGGSELGLHLERVEQLFDNHSISRKQREAQENLNRSVASWKELAGRAAPEVLIRERPRLEELAGHIRVISNEQVPDGEPDDVQLLLGLASLLAELSRRFPVERVPLLMDDIFEVLSPGYHDVARELIARASNRRQVILETGDAGVARWAAAEAVAGNALLITDQDVDLPTAHGATPPQRSV